MQRAVSLAVLLVVLSVMSARPAAALSVVQTILVGSNPFGAVQTPDGHLYVANSGTNTVSVVDPAAATNMYTPAAPTITVGRGPADIAMDPIADRAYVSNTDDQTVSVIDVAAGAVIATIASGGIGAAVDPGLGRLYVASLTKVLVFDTVTLQQVATIPAQGTTTYWGIALDTTRHLGYVSDLNGGGVVVLDLRTNSVATTIDVGGRVRFALATDPAGGRVFAATDEFGSTLSVIDSNTNAVISTVSLPFEIPRFIAVHAAGRLYVTENQQTGAADLADIDLTTSTVTRHPIQLDQAAPSAAGFALVGAKVYVAINSSNVLAVMDESAPLVNATIAPSAPKTNDTVTASVFASDRDGDPLTYTYQWMKNGNDIAGATTLAFDLSVTGNGDRGDGIAFRVTASDGTHTTTATSQTIVVADTAPVLDSATIAPTSVRTNDVLTAAATAHDADADGLTFAYQWTRNGVDIAGATSTTLDLSVAGNGSRGDSMAVRVTASDGSLASQPLTSNAAVIADSAPVATVALSPTSPTTQSVLIATTTASDPDADALSFTYVWRVNGIVRRTTVTAATTDGFDLGRPGNGNKGDVVSVELTASDATLTSDTATSSAVIGRGR